MNNLGIMVDKLAKLRFSPTSFYNSNYSIQQPNYTMSNLQLPQYLLQHHSKTATRTYIDYPS